MQEILAYIPTYSPSTEADINAPRSYARLTQEQIKERIASGKGRIKPWLYMDAIDSVLNIRPDINLVIGDGRSTDSMREHMNKHWVAGHIHDDITDPNPAHPSYFIENYPEKMSQWVIFNDILKKYSTPKTKYFVYTSSDVIWLMDWVGEAIKEFERNPKLQILFPCVNCGDNNLRCQIATGPRDLDPILPPYQEEAKAPVLNGYVMIFRMDFLRAFGGYPTIFRNCYSESFLHFMCLAVGGEQRLLPRGWVHHYGTGDLWQENGSFYYYNEEKMMFQDIMNSLQMAKGIGMMNVEFLKKLLYKK